MGVVKGLLRRSLGQAVLSWEELVTTIIEVKNVINRRPITYLWESSEPGGGVPIPLCLEQFLLPPPPPPPRTDGKKEESGLTVSKEFQRGRSGCLL